MFCHPLEGHTRWEDTYLKVDEFFTNEGLQWKNCVGVCTDSPRAMMGEHVGFVAKVKAIGNEHITFTHCMIHQKALIAKRTKSPELDIVLCNTIKIINFVPLPVICFQTFAKTWN